MVPTQNKKLFLKEPQKWCTNGETWKKNRVKVYGYGAKGGFWQKKVVEKVKMLHVGVFLKQKNKINIRGFLNKFSENTFFSPIHRPNYLSTFDVMVCFFWKLGNSILGQSAFRKCFWKNLKYCRNSNSQKCNWKIIQLP